MEKEILDKAKKIKFLFTDCDGVLTDTGVYYSETGEELKRFSVRDGMGVELLRKNALIDTGIMSGEDLPLLHKRAEKLKIKEVHLGIKDKKNRMTEVIKRLELDFDEIAYIGDDVNDLEVMELAGLTASPKDAIGSVKTAADFICENKGGHGAFREFADLILTAKNLN